LGSFNAEAYDFDRKPVDFELFDANSLAKRILDPAPEHPHTDSVADDGNNTDEEHRGESNDMPALHEISAQPVIVPAAILTCNPLRKPGRPKSAFQVISLVRRRDHRRDGLG